MAFLIIFRRKGGVMGSRQSLSRSQSRIKGKSKPSARRSVPQAERNSTGVLLFFLIVFLILLVVLLQARISSGQAVLLGLVLLTLLICLLGAWLVRRRQASVLTQTGRLETMRAVRRELRSAPALARPGMLLDPLLLSPGEFEDFVGDLLESTGQWSDVRRVGGAGDRGADLLARDRFGRPFIVQCKRYHTGHKVNAGEIRDFLGARDIYGADEGLFVTTSTFTEAARANVGPFKHTVFLWNGEKLQQLIQAYWEALPARWKERAGDSAFRSEQLD
jgi:hypothetical protein